MKDCVFEDYLPQYPDYVLKNGGWKLETREKFFEHTDSYFMPVRFRIQDVDTYARYTAERPFDPATGLLLNPVSGDSDQADLVESSWTVTNFSGNIEDLLYYDPMSYVAVRSNVLPSAHAKSETPIDAHGICRYVDNHSGKDIFVPLKTRKEWKAFTDNPPPNVDLVKCALAFRGACERNGLYYGVTQGDTAPCDGVGDQPLGPNSANRYYAPYMPYARVEDEVNGAPWPVTGKGTLDTYTFYFSCLERKPIPNMVWETKKICPSPAKAGDPPPPCHTKSYQIQYGTVCQDTWHPFEEKYQLNNMRAMPSEDISDEDYEDFINGTLDPNTGKRKVRRDTGWTWDNASVAPASILVSSGRPEECNGGGYEQIGGPPPECKPKSWLTNPSLKRMHQSEPCSE
jgi:hypothetical protein